jgi:hypothetical protein
MFAEISADQAGFIAGFAVGVLIVIGGAVAVVVKVARKK